MTEEKKQRLRAVVGPRLRPILSVLFGLFALLVVNSAYLVAVRMAEWASGHTYQNWLYILMFLGHLVLGLLLVVPVLVFGFGHWRRAHNRPNRRAVKVGYALLTAALVLLATGLVLTRIEGVFEVKDPAVRSVAWWLHVLTPLVAVWLFVLHRLAGKRIRWKVGLRWAVVAGVFAGGMLILQLQDPRRWNVEGPASGEQYFFPSLARTNTGDFIPARVLDNDAYCQECHGDAHERWSHSVHRFSSFNNPPYLASVRETRRVAFERDGDVQASRFCAGCHDVVPFFSGRFDDPNFDDVNDPTAHSGITCTACHAITHVSSPRGNSDYTIEEPLHYPFAFSDNAALAWINRQLVKAKPELHKKTFLKPLHRTAEFCGACHKVHLPEELNHYKWLRGQNHYDSYHLSGVSGHGAQSFYYPPKAEHNCNGCHMKLGPSTDFGAKDYDGTSELKIHDHLFPSANTGIPHIVGMPDSVIEEHERFNEGVMRVDLFGIKPGGRVDSPLIAPLRPEVPSLTPGRSYLLETVVRTMKMGHHFTQGTADSNEVWVELTATSGGRVVGKSGGMSPDELGRAVDPWSYFINVYMLDRNGDRIDRRNAQDIFVPLYNHQIPPGAADVVHYLLELPPDVSQPVTVEVKLQYRKFDTTYLRYVARELEGSDDGYVNDLPVMTLATDTVTFPVVPARDGASGRSSALFEETELAADAPEDVPEWMRWNDYGIGLLRQRDFTGAEEAFQRVEELGRPDGPLNLARVYLAQGTVQDRAIEALERAAAFEPPAPAWSIAWFTGQVNKQNGYLDEAIAAFRSLLEADDAETREREFDFSQDYRVLTELGQTLVERARQERGEARRPHRDELLAEAATMFQRALELDPENLTAHYNLNLVFRQLGRDDEAEAHFAAYQKYRPDDNARDRAIAVARASDPAADHAADAIVLYDLRRPGAFGLEARESPAPTGPREPDPVEVDPLGGRAR